MHSSTRKPFGTLCRIRYRYNGDGSPPSEGCFLKSTGGSVYEVLEARSIAGNTDHLSLLCLRTDPASLTDLTDACIAYTLVWDRRNSSRRSAARK